MWLLVVLGNSFLDVLDMGALHSAEHSKNGHQDNCEAGLLHDPLGDSRFISPGSSLSTFTKGNHLAEKAEAEG